MLPSSSTSHQALPPSLRTAYVYLLVSQQHPGTFKVGVTKRPAMRFAALTKRFGEFDLQASMLVVARCRRAALDLEGVLRAVFDAPTWRAKPQLPPAKKARPQPSDGDSEWYRMAAFGLMSSFIGGMIKQDKNCDFHRFSLVQNIQASDLWRDHLRNAGTWTRFRTDRDLEIDATARLARSEANFKAVQAWMQQRRHQLVSATPFTNDGQGNRRRTFVFRDTALHDPSSGEIHGGSGQDLASACIVSYRYKHGFASFSYLGSVTVPLEGEAFHRVDFLITPSFTQAFDDCPMLRDLLTRITNWLAAPPLPQ